MELLTTQGRHGKASQTASEVGGSQERESQDRTPRTGASRRAGRRCIGGLYFVLYFVNYVICCFAKKNYCKNGEYCADVTSHSMIHCRFGAFEHRADLALSKKLTDR